ncbi:hypothetical protein, partial [Pseudonocardia sp. H11422]|uniref:hypothetical protein n=1 Tax=Pseudonocardia sp. H11422 TaxID=2835866 RepID=UPI001BDDBAAA
LDRPQPQHLQRPMIQLPAVVLTHTPILSDHAIQVDLLMNSLVRAHSVFADETAKLSKEKWT